MARDLITPIKTSDMSTGSCRMTSANMVKVSTANGAYIKTTGLDASRLLFCVARTTKNGGVADGAIYVVPGSTASKSDYEPGLYSTLNYHKIVCSLTTIIVKRDVQYFTIKETAKFLDTDNYIKFNFSTGISSGGGTTERTLIGAIYLGR